MRVAQSIATQTQTRTRSMDLRSSSASASQRPAQITRMCSCTIHSVDLDSFARKRRAVALGDGAELVQRRLTPHRAAWTLKASISLMRRAKVSYEGTESFSP